MPVNLDGLIISDETLAALRRAQARGQRVVHKVVGAGQYDDCYNCGGVQYLWFCYYPPKPPLGDKSIVSTVIDDELVKVESETFACPVCNADAPTRLGLIWQTSGLETSEREWRLDYFQGMPDKDEALQACRALLAQTPHPTGLLTLHGDYGRGKSGMLKAVVAQFIRAGVPAAYVPTNDLLISLRATFNDSAHQTEQEILARYSSFQVLALDEIDRTGDTAWTRATLFSLLDRRYNQRQTRATLLALNLAPERLSGDYRYLQSRLTDGAIVRVGGDDLRGQGDQS